MAVGSRNGLRHRMCRSILQPVFAGLLLTGCVQTGQPRLASADRSVALESAYVQSPVGGPQVMDVIERAYPNATEQRIVLSNRSAVSGSNVMTVQFFGPVGNTGTGRTPLANMPLAIGNLVREARAAVPGVAMQRSPLFVQNRYGPFGYAVGRSGADVCLYAWQRISGADTSTLLMRARGTIQIRLRICDPAASEEHLLYTMYGLTIRAYFSSITWNPYGAPPVADPRLGSLGSPILPASASGFEAVAEAPRAPLAQPRRRATGGRPAQAEAPAPVVTAPLPAPVGPLVPPPPSGATAATAVGQPLATASSGQATPAVAAEAATSVAVAPLVPPPPATAACTPADRATGRC